MKEIRINRAGGFPALSGSAALLEASPEELRVLLCLIEAEAAALPTDAAALARAAGCSPARTGSALRYWCEVGVLIEAEAEAEAATAPPTNKTAKRLQPAAGIREMGAAEAAAVVEREQLSTFIDACQQLAGRVFSTPDLNMLISLVDELPFSHEYMMTLASFCKKKSGRSRFSVRYLAQVAYAMLERECMTVEQLEAYIATYEKFASEEWRLRKLLGIGERRLTQREKDFFMTWTGYGYGEEIVGIAYDITVDRTGKASLPYMDKLLRSFYEAGCHSESDVQAYLDREREEHAAKKLIRHAGTGKTKRESAFATGKSEKDPSATKGSSFHGGDYMAAALRRSYGDDGES